MAHIDSFLGSELLECDADLLPPALRLCARSRIKLGKEMDVVLKGFGEKLQKARVALDVQQENWDSLCDLQARLGFTHAFATDASEGEVPRVQNETLLDCWGWPRGRAAAAVVAHTGVWGLPSRRSACGQLCGGSWRPSSLPCLAHRRGPEC